MSHHSPSAAVQPQSSTSYPPYHLEMAKRIERFREAAQDLLTIYEPAEQSAEDVPHPSAGTNGETRCYYLSPGTVQHERELLKRYRAEDFRGLLAETHMRMDKRRGRSRFRERPLSLDDISCSRRLSTVRKAAVTFRKVIIKIFERSAQVGGSVALGSVFMPFPRYGPQRSFPSRTITFCCMDGSIRLPSCFLVTAQASRASLSDSVGDVCRE